jgi:hypothetical protein
MPWVKVERYRERAAQLRTLADGEDDPNLKAEILWIANQYEELAKKTAEQLRDGPPSG